MSQPVQDLRGGCQFGPLWDNGSVNHQHGQPKMARGVQLGARTCAARILGHDQFGFMRLHQGDIIVQRERPARNYNLSLAHRDTVGFIHQTQQIVMLGLRGKLFQVHPANSKEYPLGGASQRRNRSRNIRHMMPRVSATTLPCGTGQRSERNSRLGTSFGRVPAHLRGKGMGGINDMGHRVFGDVARQPIGPTKPADPRRQGLRARAFHTSRVRISGIHPLFAHSFGQGVGFGGAAKNQEMGHG